MRNVVSVTEQLPVVVGVDDAPSAAHSVDIAAAEAVHRGVPLVIVHAWPGWHRGPGYRAVLPDREAGRHVLDLAVQRAHHIHPGLQVRTEHSDESATKALLELSARACLLVVGHCDGPGRRTGWGSTAAYLAHHSLCPLLVQRGPVPSRGSVVVAVSGRSTATLGFAHDMAARANCCLTAVHVWMPAQPSPDTARRRAAEQSLADVLTVWESQPQVPVESLLIDVNEVPYTVQRASQRSRLLVAGMGHKGWTVEAVRRSLDPHTRGRQACPVLLMPPGWSRPVAAEATAVATVAARR